MDGLLLRRNHFGEAADSLKRQAISDMKMTIYEAFYVLENCIKQALFPEFQGKPKLPD